MLSLRLVARALTAILEHSRPNITAAMQGFEPNIELGRILPHYTPNVDAKLLPLIMVDQKRVVPKWVALPDIAEYSYSFWIWGVLAYDRADFVDDLIGQMGYATMEACNKWHYPVNIPGGDVAIHFGGAKEGSEPPCYDLQFGATKFSAGVCNCFVARWKAQATLGVRDERPDATVLAL